MSPSTDVYSFLSSGEMDLPLSSSSKFGLFGSGNVHPFDSVRLVDRTALLTRCGWLMCIKPLSL